MAFTDSEKYYIRMYLDVPLVDDEWTKQWRTQIDRNLSNVASAAEDIVRDILTKLKNLYDMIDELTLSKCMRVQKVDSTVMDLDFHTRLLKHGIRYCRNLAAALNLPFVSCVFHSPNPYLHISY